jgi:hypothetical protein
MHIIMAIVSYLLLLLLLLLILILLSFNPPPLYYNRILNSPIWLSLPVNFRLSNVFRLLINTLSFQLEFLLAFWVRQVNRDGFHQFLIV